MILGECADSTAAVRCALGAGFQLGHHRECDGKALSRRTKNAQNEIGARRRALLDRGRNGSL
jgi:hypothetical protein